MNNFNIVASTAINAFEVLRQTHGYSLIDLWEAINERLGFTPQGIAVALAVVILFGVGLCAYTRYSETLDEFIETILHLFGTIVFGAILTLLGVFIGGFCSDLLVMSGCIILALSTVLMLGYMFVMVFVKRKE